MPPKANAKVFAPTGSPPTFTLVIRPLPTPVSHKSFLRVHVHRDVLRNLDLKTGALVQIKKALAPDVVITGDDHATVWPALAWLTTDSHVTKNIALVGDVMRGLIGAGFENKMVLGKYEGEVLDALSIEVELVDKNVDLNRAAEGWKWFLEHTLVESKIVFEGCVFEQIEFKGRKLSWRITKVTAAGGKTGSKTEEGHVPAFNVTENTTVQISGYSNATPAQTAAVQAPENNAAKTTASPAKVGNVIAPSIAFSNIGGLSKQIRTFRNLLRATLHQSHHFSKLGLTPPRGILLYGPPGTGKSMLLKAAASETTATALHIDGSIVGKYMGESEAAIRKIFKQAREKQPSIIFIDEIDSLAPKRNSADSGEGRIVSTLITELDNLAVGCDGSAGEGGAQVVVVAATNRPNVVDEALRRPGRFDREIEIEIPGVDARREILELMLKKIPKAFGDEFIRSIASRTHGFVGADLESLVRGGVMKVMTRLETELELPDSIREPEEETLKLTENDLEDTLKDIRPTAMREIFLETPKVRWSDIGGQEEVKQRLRETVEWPLTHPEAFARLGATPRKGLLLYGPPGCSKTLTAKALATEAGLNFLAVKGPELFSMYVGESERAVREIFRKARAASPSIIFFDEIDALSATRSGGRGNGVNVLTALLNEMDGIEVLKNVTVLAATNRPDMIDPALLRPGRLDTLLYIGPPNYSARLSIFQIQKRRIAFSPDVSLEELADQTEGYSGAEIVNICNEAVLIALRKGWNEERKDFENAREVTMDDFEEAMSTVVQGISPEMIRGYELWEKERRGLNKI